MFFDFGYPVDILLEITVSLELQESQPLLNLVYYQHQL